MATEASRNGTTGVYSVIKSLDFKTCFGIGIMHFAAILAMADWAFDLTYVAGYITTSGLVVGFIMYVLTGGIGITFCFHRLLTHRSFETKNWIRYGSTILGAAAWEGPPIRWVAQHQKHHRFSDKEGDPHSPNQGAGWFMRTCWFLWAHTLWFLFKDPNARELEEKYAPALLRDPGIVIIDKFFWLPQVAIATLLFGLGYAWGGLFYALSWVVCGVPLRIFFVHHFTWAVNSVAHTFGYQTYTDTDDLSRNNFLVAIFGFGEGWHNNHHKYETSAAHGLRWWELDPTYWMIKTLCWLGLAWNVRVPKDGKMVKIHQPNS